MTFNVLRAVRLIVSGATLLWPLLALTAPPPIVPAAGSSTAPPPEMPAPMDREVEALKTEVIGIKRRAQDTIRNVQYPAYSHVTTYFGVATSDVVVRDISVRIDSSAATRHEYDRRAAIALINDGLAPLDQLNVQPGDHTLTAHVVYVLSSAKDKDKSKDKQVKPQTLDQSFNFTKTDLAAQLVIEVYRPTFWGPPALRLTQWEPKP